MRALWAIANLTLKEYARRKLYVVTLLMMFIVAGTGLLANPFTVGTQSRLIRDLALLFIQLFTIFLGMALGATALSNEIERKSIYPFLSKPISRGTYLRGKCLAIAIFLTANAFVLGGLLLLIVRISAGETHWAIFSACLLIAVEATVVASFCLFFSTFMTVSVTFASMVLVYIVGNLSHVYALTLTADNPVMRVILRVLKSIIPYFDYFSIRSAVTHNLPVSPPYIATAAGYGLLYVTLAMLLAEAAFSWKDL